MEVGCRQRRRKRDIALALLAGGLRAASVIDIAIVVGGLLL